MIPSTPTRRSPGSSRSSSGCATPIPDQLISVDTWRAAVAKQACAAGADLINDTWGGHDPDLAEVAAEFGAGLVCSHTGGADAADPPVPGQLRHL